ncbi:hypothetical protein Fmac_014218 [Flemingia macrophylla]|uniref:Protein kinase domain-containing protein n=1 Tax=Flemingia macrophylla TaxID=520843 RepID=A0ABD1MD62_9FABA
MAAALECWSRRSAGDEDHATLMQPPEAPPRDPSAVQKKLQRLTRNVSEAIASLRNSSTLPTTPPNTSGPPSFATSAPPLTFPRSSSATSASTTIPCLSGIGFCFLRRWKLSSDLNVNAEKLFYSQAGFDVKDVFLHMKLMEQATEDEQAAILIQEECDGEIQVQGSFYKLTFACNSPISWPAMSGALDSYSICCKKIQIFEKKGFTLGIVLLLVLSGGGQDKLLRTWVESALKIAVKRPKVSGVKLPFGLCGCQEEKSRERGFGEIDEDGRDALHGNGFENFSQKIQLQVPLPSSSFLVSVDEWQTIQLGLGGDEIEEWLLNSDSLEFAEQIGPNSYKGTYMGKRVGIEKIRGCEKGNSYEFELRKDLLALMTCGQRNIMQFCGVCVDDNHGLCVVTKFVEGGSVHDLMLKNKKLPSKDAMRIAVDVAEALKFMNDHGVSYRDLNTQRIMLDKRGNACLADMGIVTACKSVREAMDYETDGYRWLAPEIIAGDPESVTETWMSNVYSFGMVIWEMVTGEAAYSAYSPVQAAVGIAACGLRPEIPKDCPQTLKSLMTKCWNNTPSKRPQFSEILAVLLPPNNYNK